MRLEIVFFVSEKAHMFFCAKGSLSRKYWDSAHPCSEPFSHQSIFEVLQIPNRCVRFAGSVSINCMSLVFVNRGMFVSPKEDMKVYTVCIYIYNRFGARWFGIRKGFPWKDSISSITSVTSDLKMLAIPLAKTRPEKKTRCTKYLFGKCGDRWQNLRD